MNEAGKRNLVILGAIVAVTVALLVVVKTLTHPHETIDTKYLEKPAASPPSAGKM